MAGITSVRARQIFDSRGNPTIEAEVRTKRAVGIASVPSGASTGAGEAKELRDGGRSYGGKGVTNAVMAVNAAINRRLRGHDAQDQQDLDEELIELDGTPDKRRLGANATLAVSLAAARAAAAENDTALYTHLQSLCNGALALPTPSFNIINGGQHAGNQLDIQEYMVLPVGAKSFAEAMRIGAEVYAHLRSTLAKKFGKAAVNVGDEGGFAPPLSCPDEPLRFIRDAVEECGYARKAALGIDAAASSFWRNGTYCVEGETLSPSKLLALYESWIGEFGIVSIEDPFHENAFDDFARLASSKAARGTQIVGDDLTVTAVGRIRRAIERKSCDCLLLKPNQIGTLSEALEAARTAEAAGWNVMVSHRSGETDDHFIADLAVALGTGQIKAGAPCRGERLAKYNRLLRIEEELGRGARYAGRIRV